MVALRPLDQPGVVQERRGLQPKALLTSQAAQRRQRIKDLRKARDPVRVRGIIVALLRQLQDRGESTVSGR